jgi:transposase
MQWKHLLVQIGEPFLAQKRKIRIVLAGLRGEESISVLCRREGIAESLYYSWSKEFLEAGKRRLLGDTARQAVSPEVKDLRSASMALKECVADLTLENRLLKKGMTGAWGIRGMRYPASEKLEIIHVVENVPVSEDVVVRSLEELDMSAVMVTSDRILSDVSY